MSIPVRLIITAGDRDGIGPEILVALFKDGKLPSDCQYLIIGDQFKLESLGLKFDLADRSSAFGSSVRPSLLPCPTEAPSGATSIPGFQCGWAIEESAKRILAGEADALVTGPISKERLQDGGFPYQGHTDFLAKLCGGDRDRSDGTDVTMMLANSQMRASLVTTHVPLSGVSATLTKMLVQRAIRQTADGLRRFWGIQSPTILVCGLNPHSGENGRMGREEIEIIRPAMESVSDSDSSLRLEGPFPADTLFAQIHRGQRKSDAVVAMYHDQGLIPVKLLDFPNTVNITLGLPLIRTSVDHGVGFDIAGQNKSDPSSFLAAVREAASMVSAQTV